MRSMIGTGPAVTTGDFGDPTASEAMATLLPTAGVFAENQSQLDEMDSCSLPNSVWQSWLLQMPQGQPLLVRFTLGNEQEVLSAALCHGGDDGSDRIFLPSRQDGSFDGHESIRVEPVMEAIPVATKIVLKPLDNSVQHSNIEEAVAAKLSEWHLLRKGQVIPVPIPELGDFTVEMFVEDLEPAPLVMLRGEVPLELTEPLEEVVEWSVPPPAAPPRPPTPIPDDDTMWGNPIVSTMQGITATAATAANPVVQTGVRPTSFVPFSGSGRTLGGATAPPAKRPRNW